MRGAAPDTTQHLLVTSDFPPMLGGIARCLAEITAHYPHGRLVVCAGPAPDDTGADGRISHRVHRIASSVEHMQTVSGRLAWCRHAAARARDVNASFLWCGTFKPDGYAALYTRMRLGIPYGIVLYGTELHHLRQQVRARGHKRFIARRLFNSAAVLVAISQWTRALALDVLREIGCTPERFDVRTVLLGTDPERFKPGIDTAGVRAKYGLPDGRWMLTVARLLPHKGQDVALRALALLAAREPKLRYMIIGSGPHREALGALAEALGVADRVHFLNAVPDADLPALYNVADVYVGPSRNSDGHVEGFGLSFVEASACGVPVVAGRYAGAPEAVNDGETGILVDCESAAAVAHAVQRILHDATLARQLGGGGRKTVETRFSWPRVAREIAAIADEHSLRHFADRHRASNSSATT